MDALRQFWTGLPSGVRRWAVGVGGAIAIGVVALTLQGNEVKDYLSERGYDVASVEVSTRIYQINVETGRGDVSEAIAVCEALRGRFESDGREMRVLVFYEPSGVVSGFSTEPCSAG